MCGRFAIDKIIAQLMSMYQAAANVQFNGSFNVAPTELAPIVMEDKEHERVIKLAKFGMMMKAGGKTFPLLNVQSEKAPNRKDFQSQRCIIPATGFYEWVKESPKEKQPYYFSPTDNIFSFAGMYQQNGDALSFTILTTDANELVQPIHSRMPVILTHNAVGEWLSPNASKDTLASLMHSYPANLMQVWKVSKTVNSPKNKDAVCINSL